MFSPAMLDVAAVTGIIGAITGPVGCLIGLVSYRRSQQIKALDLRLELRKHVSDIRADIEALPALMEGAQASRTAVLAAMGVLQSGASEIWKAALETDLKTVHALARELPDADETYQRSKPKKLENKLVEVHTLAVKVARLRDKYETALASDDKERDRIRADVRTRLNPVDRRVGL